FRRFQCAIPACSQSANRKPQLLPLGAWAIQDTNQCERRENHSPILGHAAGYSETSQSNIRHRNRASGETVLHPASGGRVEQLATGLCWSLPHPLNGLGWRPTLRAKSPKDGSGCAVDNLQTLGQQARIPVIKLTVSKSVLVFESKSFADHKSSGF